MRGAGVALFHEATETVLLLRRASWLSNHPETWCIPGGSIDAGELPSAGARRELLEEAGLSVGGRCLERTCFRTRDLTFYTYIFACSGQPTPTLNEESTAFEWARLRGLARRQDLHPGIMPAFGSSKIFSRFL